MTTHFLSRERQWQLASLGSAILAGILVRGILRASWKHLHRDHPPVHPVRGDESWATALAFAAGTGIAVGLARLGARAVTDKLARGNRNLFS